MDELEEERCMYATNVLYKFVTSKESRLKNGASLRQKMQKALKEGKKVDGYRADWILKSMNEVLKTLAKSAEKFNNTNFHDMISVADMTDVLQSCVNRLNKKNPKDD
jgi:hypothetical protein